MKKTFFIWHIKYNDNSEEEKKTSWFSFKIIVFFLISEDLLISFKMNTLSKAHGSKHSTKNLNKTTQLKNKEEKAW